MKLIIPYPTDQVEIINYPAGELQVRIKEDSLIANVREAEEIWIEAKIDNSASLMGLILLSDALRYIAAGPVNLRLPYLPYARADRRFVEGDCSGLEVFSRLLNACFFSRVEVLDVHNFAAAHTAVDKLFNVSPYGLINKAIADFAEKTGSKPVILLPDAGAVKRMAGYPELLHCSKHRDEKTGRLSGFEVPALDHRPVLIVDDICDGGGTFIGIADAIRVRGDANPLGLFVTHSMFSKGTAGLVQRFMEIYTTNSFPRVHVSLSGIISSTVYDAFEYMRDFHAEIDFQERN